MRSDQAWAAGHRAALRLTPLYLLTTVVTCAALVGAVLYASTANIVQYVGLCGWAAVLAVGLYSAFIAGRAAKSTDARIIQDSTTRCALADNELNGGEAHGI